MKTLGKIDQFYFFLVGVLIILTVLITFTLREIFKAINISSQLDENAVSTSNIQVDRQQLDKAINYSSNKEYIPLDVR